MNPQLCFTDGMAYLWNILYVIAGILLIPVLLWQRFVKGKRRAGWRAKLLGNVTLPNTDSQSTSSRGLTSTAQVEANPAQRIWLHAVSVGEVNLLAPLVKLIEREQPEWSLYLTVGTVTGFELAQKKYPQLTLSYAPLDFSWAVARAIDRIKPDLVVLVELEVWPNLIAGVTQRGIPLAVVNGRFSERSFRGYRRFRWLLGHVFRRLTLVAAQTDEYAERFARSGRQHVTVTGSLKFDNAPGDRTLPAIQAPAPLGWLDRQRNDLRRRQHGRAGGSPRARHVSRPCAANIPNLRLVIVPRHPERFDDRRAAHRVARLRLSAPQSPESNRPQLIVRRSKRHPRRCHRRTRPLVGDRRRLVSSAAASTIAAGRT